jgi:hypothetical protein
MSCRQHSDLPCAAPLPQHQEAHPKVPVPQGPAAVQPKVRAPACMHMRNSNTRYCSATCMTAAAVTAESPLPQVMAHQQILCNAEPTSKVCETVCLHGGAGPHVV